MQINPYLIFDGSCEAAVQFYAQCLRGEIPMLMRYSDMPAGESAGETEDCPPLPPEAKNRIMHSRLEVGGQVLMAADHHPSFPYEGIKGFSVSINVDTTEEAERVFKALAEGGSVQMPLGETFWALKFGMLTDKFGVSWMVNCARPGF